MVSEDYLKQRIMAYVSQRPRGKENAIVRSEILKNLQLFEPNLSDRKFRIFYTALPVCTSAAGLYRAKNPNEAWEWFKYLEKQVGPIHAARRYRLLLTYYPELSRPRGQQRELFPSC